MHLNLIKYFSHQYLMSYAYNGLSCHTTVGTSGPKKASQVDSPYLNIKQGEPA